MPEDACPFCRGEEHRTPPATLELGDPWRVRVVPNPFPAFARQEVVVHVPRHAVSLAELSDGELELVAEAWQARAAAFPGEYLHAFVNEGEAAGATREHTHSQLVWLEEPPPEVARELARPACALCPPPGGEELLVVAREGVAVRAAWAPRGRYELLIAPLEHEESPWTSERLPVALRLAAEAVRRLRRVESASVPFNLWLHAGGHWHLELLPRLATLAGIELGAGIYLSTLPPEEAAVRLREAAPASRTGPT